MKHTIQAIVENKFGVLARVASLFSARGYNIESLAVGETQDPSVSCMTLVVDAPDERILEQIKKQLHKLVNVVTVVDFTRKEYLDRDLLLTKIAKKDGEEEALRELEQKYHVRILEQKEKYYLLEITTERHHEEDLLRTLKKIGILELVRTGRIAIGK
ncbi:MAG: acetolactate synthase small subunit [Candidatus Omnitrophica bacterium]|nr:acetolactate synthase small subunit [Candidatus Omnitrophota bacterium]